MKEIIEMKLSEFKRRHLEPFRKGVEDGTFEKIDYAIWRIWHRLDDSKWVSIYYGEHSVEITIEDMGWTFPDWDHSFGTYMKLPNTILGKTYTDEMKEIMLNIEEKKENGNMNNIINFDFGPCTGNDNIRMSIYGIAVKNANGTFVSYDATNAAIMDVEIFNFDGAKFLYKMPVAIKDVAVGDVVIHARKPMFVTEVLAASKSLKVVDPINGEIKEIMLTRSPFGFDFATKIVNFLGNMGNATSANADNPFGNLWMLMLADDVTSSDNLLPLMLMGQGGKMDPMMMFALMGNKDSNSLLPFLMMANMNKNSGCTCGGNCGSTEAE